MVMSESRKTRVVKLLQADQKLTYVYHLGPDTKVNDLADRGDKEQYGRFHAVRLRMMRSSVHGYM